MKPVLLFSTFAAAFLGMLLLMYGCTPMPPKPPPGPLKASCGSACDNAGRKLHCDAWLDVDGGETCVDRCVAVQADGTVQFDLECLSQAKTCAAVDGC